MEEVGEATGYQEPDVNWHDLAEETLRLVINGDEEVAGLNVSVDHIFTDGEIDAHLWASANVVGDAVGDSRLLRKLNIQKFCEDEELEVDEAGPWLSGFLSGLARNRSIEHLTITEYNFPWNPIEIISPFFMHNRNLRCIEIHICDLSEHFPSFLLALSTCETNQLERIYLNDNNLGGRQVTRLIKALHAQRNLKEIHLCDNEIFRSGFVELSRLLQHPHSNIHRLEIGDKLFVPRIDDECMTILTGALVVNKTIKILDVGNGRHVTATGWHVFSAVLCSPISTLESLTIENLDDEGFTIIGDALIKNNTLNSLKLRYIDRTISAGWQDLFKLLRNPSCALRELGVDFWGFDHVAGPIEFADSLAVNSSLKKFNMGFNSITAAGWVAFFNKMLDSTFSLEELHLGNLDELDDRGAAALVNLLATASTLQLLKLSRCQSITTNGWREFARVLQNGSKVKTLKLDGNNLNEEVFIDFATALANNTSLSKLRICGSVITEKIWCAFDHVFDVSCVESTYISNHTLQTIEIENWVNGVHPLVVPEELSRVLKMNTIDDKVAVARQKIIALHFSGINVDIQAFAAMAVPILPDAIEWIGRDSVGFSLMYHVTRAIPALFEKNTYAKFARGKRKHPS